MRFSHVAGLIAAVVLIGLPLPSSALAAGTCPNYIENDFDGGETTSNQYYGVYATIETRTPAICTGTYAAYGTSTAWVMLHGNRSNPSANGWAQVGFGNFASQGGMQTFTQYALCDLNCPYTTAYAPPPPAGSTDYYEVVYEPAYSSVWMIAQDGLARQTPWDPYAGGLWASPVTAMVSNETRQCASDVIGTQSNAAAFDNLQGETSPLGAWNSFTDFALGGTGAYPLLQCAANYHQKWGVNPRLFYTWTYPLTR